MFSFITQALLTGALSLAQPANCTNSDDRVQAPLAEIPAPHSASVPAASYCPVENFSTCGGDLNGTWNLNAHCTAVGEQVPCEFPFDGEAACQDRQNTVSCTLEVSGTMTFSGSKLRIVRNEEIAARYTLSNACTAAVRADAGDAKARCESLSRVPIMSCQWNNDLCTCDSRVPNEPMDETASFSTKDGVLSFGEFTANYCATKDGLTLQFDPHPKSWQYWVLTK